MTCLVFDKKWIIKSGKENLTRIGKNENLVIRDLQGCSNGLFQSPSMSASIFETATVLVDSVESGPIASVIATRKVRTRQETKGSQLLR